MVPIGSVLAGKYRVERVLGQGGMGIVVQATHLQLHQFVAIKFLLPEVLDNPQVVERFLREAQAAVRLRSEHVARVIDVGSMENNAPYIVFEYLHGQDLAAFARQQLTIGQIIDLMLQACEALAEAHSLGIVHRDIKPANFFITTHSDGTLLLKVLDFGISKAAQGTLSNGLTATSVVMGTPAYMSPEQVKSARDVDLRSDIWAVGIVLYELLNGTPPFAAETFGSMAIKVATEALPPLPAQLPPGLTQIIYKCLEKDPNLRFQNVAELSYALAPYAQSTAKAQMSVERTSRVLGTEPPISTSMLTAGPVTVAPTTRRRWPLITGVAAVLAAATIAIVIGVGRGGGGDAEPTTQPVATPDPPKPPPPPAIDAAIAVAPVDAAPAPVSVDAAVAAAPTPDAGTVVTIVKPSKPKPPRPNDPKKPPKPNDPKPPPGNGSDDVLGTRQ